MGYSLLFALATLRSIRFLRIYRIFTTCFRLSKNRLETYSSLSLPFKY